ncbi:hypothetical protein LTR36_001912 [Oleoguttula mirabilis]|uniref:Uncharacterized protein n=1 Tax=Oleoguttula mirabilis TaxID=1507867 RepID=A0AAV9JNW3_9PEZI|nr:hypothetical protein LTR36_001912 [Oleoguttula mirabilis]
MPLLGPTAEDRNRIFQQLKPQCVALSQAALALNRPKADVQAVSERLEELQQTLSKTKSQPDALDAKLADYVFFPLSQVLKLSQRISIHCLELCLQCIAILVDQGWRDQIQSQLAAQIVILCTLMAEKKPTGFAFGEATEELQAAALWCLHHVFIVAGDSAACRAFLTSEGNFPQLGQTISVTLDCISTSVSAETQTAGASALQALIQNIADREICASFLPGIVSKLTKILTPSTKQRRNHQVLISCVRTLAHLLVTTLSDDTSASTGTKPAKASTIIDAAWIENAATQLKPALTSILRLADHSRADVQGALEDLCLMLLERCGKSLSNCCPLALETLLMLSFGRHAEDGRMASRLERLVKTDVSLAAMLRDFLYDSLRSLPTIMQGADEQKKVAKMHQVSAAYGLLVSNGADTGVIDRMLAGSLRDSMVITLQVPGTRKETSPSVSSIQSLDLAVLSDARGNTEFSSALVQYKGQEDIVGGIEQFAELISTSSSSVAFAADLARSLRHSQGEAQIATFWLLLTATQTALQRKDAVSDFLDFGGNMDASSYRDYLEELYSFSLSVLTDSSDEPPDTRLQALALRSLALRAQAAGSEFRYELIDALYPVLHTLATPGRYLQQDSITTLNIFTKACGYSNVKDLIVENVDYLTNAVALKLNAFDVSPQAPQVLLMMVRLAGPSLLPYLEDTVESIFAALEDYHGYPLLVEMLFKVLSVMAEEGVKAPQLASEDRKAVQSSGILHESSHSMRVNELAELLRERAVEAAKQQDEEIAEHEAHPRRPWKKAEDSEKVTDDDADSAKDEEDERETGSDEDQQIEDTDLPPPAPKTYNLLFKITELTQHFLPVASPSLRASLLTLIRTTVPAIAKHENSFLPLINTLWPEIVTRLDDDEPHVQATALDIVSVLCEHAGDFMRGRVVQLWPGMVETQQKTITAIMDTSHHTRIPKAKHDQAADTALTLTGPSITQAIMRMQASPADYSNTATRLVWDALVNTLTVIVRSVPLPAELFDDALKMLEPVLESREEVRAALEEENADALWLARLRTGAMVPQVTPVVPEGMVWRFAAVAG